MVIRFVQISALAVTNVALALASAALPRSDKARAGWRAPGLPTQAEGGLEWGIELVRSGYGRGTGGTAATL